MSTPLHKCAVCGAVIHRLNSRCGYCQHWNVDPANPQDPPADAPPAPVAAPTPPPPAAPVAPPIPVTPAPSAASPSAPPAKPAPTPPPMPAPGAATAATTPAATTPPPMPSASRPAPPKPTSQRPAPAKVAMKTRVLEGFVKAPETADVWAQARGPGKRTSSDAEVDAARARIDGVIAAAYWVATADDELSDEEYDGLVDTLSELLGDDVDEDELESRMLAWDAEIEADEEAFVGRAVAAIGTGPMRRQALEIATVVAAADDDLSDDEEEALGDLSSRLGFADRESERIIERALASLDE